MPEVRAGFKIFPFAFVRRRNSMADVAAEWLAARVMRRTFPATIQFGNRRIKPLVEGPEIVRAKIRGGFENWR